MQFAHWNRTRLLLVFLLTLVVPASASGQDQFFQSDGISIRYRVEGSGPTVILVHGFTGSLDMWEETGVFDALSTEYRVVALDCRGHGLSDKPEDSSAYGAQMSRDILNLMDHLDAQKAHLVGYSMGSRLTGLFLVTWPERLITATLGASPPRRNWNETEEERAELFSANVRQRAESAAVDDGQNYAALAAIPASWEGQVVRDEQLAANQVPVLAIVGSEDPRVEGLQEVSNILANMKLTIVDGATHSGEKGLPRRPEFRAAIQKFLAEHSDR